MRAADRMFYLYCHHWLTRLAGYYFFKISLGLLQKLFAAIGGSRTIAGECRNEIPCLQSHMKLQVGNIFAEVFTEGGFYRGV
jgi:hypothetical protein